MRNWFPAIWVIPAIFFVSCGEKELAPKPENLIPEEKYVKIITELQLLDSWVYTTEEITNPDSIMFEMFSYYEITEEQFEKSHAYYQSYPENHLARVDSALSILEKQQKRLNQSSED